MADVSMGVVSLGDLLGLGGQRPQAEDLDPGKHVQKLRNVFDALNEARGDVDWLPGLILRHKFPASAMVNLADRPAMFMGWLERPIEGQDLVREPGNLGSVAAALTWDCRIMVVKNGKALMYLADSTEWEPHPDYLPQAEDVGA